MFAKSARLLADWGVKEVVITLGSMGSVIYHKGVFYHIPAYKPATVIDTTGCGDTYMAGYLSQRIKGRVQRGRRICRRDGYPQDRIVRSVYRYERRYHRIAGDHCVSTSFFVIFFSSNSMPKPGLTGNGRMPLTVCTADRF